MLPLVAETKILKFESLDRLEILGLDGNDEVPIQDGYLEGLATDSRESTGDETQKALVVGGRDRVFELV